MKAGWLALLLVSSVQAAPLQVQADDDDVQLALSAHLDLARALRQGEAPDSFERQRLCALTTAQSRQLMQTEGYYAPKRITLDCAAGTLQVEVGAIARLRKVVLLADGVDDEQLQRWRRWLFETTMREGRAFVRERWTDGKQELLTRVRAHGYPLARFSQTQAEVDPDAAVVDVRLQLDPGPLVRVGHIEVQGLRHHDQARLLALLGLTQGEPVSEAGLVEAQQRVLKSQLFDSVVVELETEKLEGDRMPVLVRVVEAPLQQLGLGLGWSSLTGPRTTLEHQHRRFLGQPLRSSVRVALARDSQSLEAEFSSHPGTRQRRNLLALRWEREEGTEAPYEQASLRFGQVIATRAHDRALFVEALHSRQGSQAQRVSADALLLRWQPTWRAVDSVLLPTEGQLLSLQVAGGPARSKSSDAPRERGNLARVQARYQLWHPLEEGRGLYLRLELGQVFAPSRLELPESLRWRAGGDESVRGYDFRSLGPRVAGQEVGGRVVWTTSAEFLQPLPRHWVGGLDGLAIAAFLDAGQAAASWREASSAALAPGIGMRWRSPVGLLRVDLAKGQKRFDGGWRVHVAIGLAL